MPFDSFCPIYNPKWGASMLEAVGPRGKLKGLLDCPTVRDELKRRGRDLADFGIKEPGTVSPEK